MRRFLSLRRLFSGFDESQLYGGIFGLEDIWTFQADPTHPQMAISHFPSNSQKLYEEFL